MCAPTQAMCSSTLSLPLTFFPVHPQVVHLLVTSWKIRQYRSLIHTAVHDQAERGGSLRMRAGSEEQQPCPESQASCGELAGTKGADLSCLCWLWTFKSSSGNCISYAYAELVLNSTVVEVLSRLHKLDARVASRVKVKSFRFCLHSTPLWIVQ